MNSSFFYSRYYFVFSIIIVFIIIISFIALNFQNIEINNISSSPIYLVSSDFTWPVPGYSSISSTYGQRKIPTAGASGFHYGIDIPAPTGTSFVSSINGKIIYADFNRCKWLHTKSRK